MDKLGFSRSLKAATAMQGDPEGPGMMKRMKSGDLFTGHACVHIGVFLQPHPPCIEITETGHTNGQILKNLTFWKANTILCNRVKIIMLVSLHFWRYHHPTEPVFSVISWSSVVLRGNKNICSSKNGNAPSYDPFSSEIAWQSKLTVWPVHWQCYNRNWVSCSADMNIQICYCKLHESITFFTFFGLTDDAIIWP